MQHHLHLFTDGSVAPRLKIGYGAYLLLEAEALAREVADDSIVTKRFEPTSSTKLELQTLIWALDAIGPTERPICVYTDSQNIIGLPARRSYLEQHDFRSRKHKLLAHHELYRAFFRQIDALAITFEKVEGHRPQSERNSVDRIFSQIDQAARRALREGR